MDNLIYGIITISICLAGYYFSWRFMARDNYRWAILLLVLCGLALRFYTSCDFYIHEWDEKLHALVAKNMMDHPLRPTLYENPVLPYDYRDWASNHVWVHKPPLPLWTMSASMFVFGVNEIALRLPTLILSTLGIWLIFSIGAYFFNKKTGYIAALLFSINGLVIELTAARVATDHMDVFFMFFVLLAVFFSVQFVKTKNVWFNVLVGIAIGAAILSKWLPALIVLPVWLLLAYQSEKFSIKAIVLHFLLILVTLTIVFLPWQLYIYSEFPKEAAWTAGLNMKHFTEVLDKQGGPFYYFFNKIRVNYGELIYLPLLWFVWMWFKKPKDYKLLALLIWFFVPAIIFSFAKTKMQGYILFTTPALFLLTGAFWTDLKEKRIKIKVKWLTGLILVLLIVLPVRYSIERIKPFEKRDRNPEWVVALRELNEKDIQNGVLFNHPKPLIAMFYTDLTVYPFIPGKSKIEELISKGYQIMICDDGKIPKELKEINGVVYLKGL
ncbi:MAG: hypothetical protein A2W91_02010 [Bacteroidetes bacterium GWF2_38_335]|nr:MAG: hypothetical protein A2W91_02010 [Bacteroidetes bacterium GWF2_38_335]OFY80628.1 MAG: hypothetical protein A2281_05025 [Bacteroidetes bacterium RIFOXYA12_FULL_38_20]HBS86968.1 hypothetical protein [Bacteroidales bacterium]